TLQELAGVIERERPLYVVVGHGKPHTSDEALRIAEEDLRHLEAVLAHAEEDLSYLEAVLAHAEAGRPAEDAGQIAFPQRSAGTADRTMHASNVARACEAAGAAAV